MCKGYRSRCYNLVFLFTLVDCLSWIGLQELSKHYYTYKGSLTTAPYFESVTWIIYRTPIYVSRGQVRRDSCLMPMPRKHF